MTDVLTGDVSAGLLLLRVVVGATMAAHGLNKFFGGGRITGTARWFDGLGMRPGRFHAVLAATTETAAGVLFAAGFLTPFAAAAIVSLMFVAALTVHRAHGFFVVADGWEYNLVLATAAVSVAITGPGSLSIDAIIGWTSVLDGWWGLLISAVGGVAAASAVLACFFRPAPAS